MPAFIDRCDRAGIDVRDIQIAFVDRDVLPEQQLAIVQGPVQRVPGVLLPADDETRRRARIDVCEVDIVAHPIPVITVERNAFAVVRPQRAAVNELPLRQLTDASRARVVVKLCVLVSALILQKDEPVRRSGLWRPGDADRVGVVSKLFAHSQRGGDPVHLLGVTQPCRDQHAAIRQPVEESRLPRLLVALHTRGEVRIALRYSLEDEVVALHVRQSRRGRCRRPADRECAEGTHEDEEDADADASGQKPRLLPAGRKGRRPLSAMDSTQKPRGNSDGA